MDVKKLRKKCNYTQQQLADRCGVDRRTIQYWEQGNVIPPSKLKLLELIEKEQCEMISSGNASENGVSVAAGNGSQINLNQYTERFFATLEKQQELMSRQLEEMAEMRKQAQKKDEQIDVLLGMLKTNLEQQQ